MDVAHPASSGKFVGEGPGGLAGGRLAAIFSAASGRPMAIPLELEAGQLRETLLVEGVPVADLPSGTRLRVGASVVIELGDLLGASVEPDSAPGRIVERDSGAGVSARVVTPGRIQPGDAIGIDAVPLPIEDALDLHPFQPAEALAVVEEYLVRARAAGFDEVRIIHGRGRGVQRELVRRLLATSTEVADFCDAPPARGGWGATVVRLRRASGAPPP